MACKTVSVLGAATPQVAIPSRLPQTQSDWQTFTQQLNTLFSQLSTTARRPAATSVPIQYATLFSSTLPPLQTTNCTVTADNSWSLFGGFSYKIVVTGSNASVVCGASGFPLPIPPNENWLLSVYGKCSGASQTFKMGLQTATTTYENTVITDATAATVDRFAIPLNLVADDASQCTLRLDFPSASGETFWFDGFQYEPSVTGSINPSPFLSTNIIAGSIVAQFITVAQLSALSANMGTLTAGKIQSSDGRFTIDCTNELITITDGTNTRMQIGEVSAGVYDVKIWNGSGTLLFDAATGLQYAGNSTQVTQVIANNSGNGQLNVNPTGGVTSNLPHANQSTQTLQVIANVGGNGQLNVNPTGGVTSTLPYANHAPSVTTTIVNTADGNGSYLSHGVVFQPHIHANQIGWGHFIGDTSGNYSGNLVDGLNLRFLHGAMSGATQNTVAGTADVNGSYLQHGVVFNPHLTGGAVGWKNLLGDTSGDTTTNLIDAANKRFLHGAMSTGVQGVISSGSQVNVNPSGGVTGQLPQANHDPTVLLSSVTGNQRNLIPDSGLKNVKAYWKDNSGGLITVTQDIDGATNAFTYLGTGAASGYLHQDSKIITVTPGTYTLSAKGNVGNIVSGNIVVAVYNPTITTQYGIITLTASRANTQITIPAGVSQVVVLFDTNNATVANGLGAGVQNMQFEPGSVMTAYRENTGDNLSGTLLIDTGNSNHIGNWQHSYMSTGVKGVISSGSQVNVNPTGGVTGNLPYANHDVSVRTTLASTAGGDGSYLNTSQVFNRHLNSANQDGLADSATYMRPTASIGSGAALPLDNPMFLLGPTGSNTFTSWPSYSGLVYDSGGTGPWSERVLTLRSTGPSTQGEARYKTTFPCVPNAYVTIKAVINNTSGDSLATLAYVDFLTAAGAYIDTVQASTTTASWNTVIASKQAPANTALLLIGIVKNASSSSGTQSFGACAYVEVTVNDPRQPNSSKAYADFTDNTSGGHVGKNLANVPDDSGSSRYAVLAVDPNRRAIIDASQASHLNMNLQYFGGIQSGTCYDGQAITFNPTYSAIPLVIILPYGETYNSTIGSATNQSLQYSASSLTTSGFTASLKIVSGGTLTARSDNFGTVSAGTEYSATLTNAPAYNNTYTVNWTLSLGSASSGTVYIRETNYTGTILYSKNYVTGQNGSKSTAVVWSGATGTSVIDISLVLDAGSTGTISASTVTFTSGTAPSTNSAVPSTAPVPWVAFPQT